MRSIERLDSPLNHGDRLVVLVPLSRDKDQYVPQLSVAQRDIDSPNS